MDVRGLFLDFLQKNREERCDVTKIQRLWNYGIGYHIQKDQDEKSSLAKNQPFLWT